MYIYIPLGALGTPDKILWGFMTMSMCKAQLHPQVGCIPEHSNENRLRSIKPPLNYHIITCFGAAPRIRSGSSKAWAPSLSVG